MRTKRISTISLKDAIGTIKSKKEKACQLLLGADVFSCKQLRGVAYITQSVVWIFIISVIYSESCQTFKAELFVKILTPFSR